MAQKKSLEKNENTKTISACDIIYTNTNSIIEKMESLLPERMQLYSDFYTECLHSLQDLFGACYISENEMSKIGMDQKTMQSFDRYTKAITKSIILQIDIMNNIQQTYFRAQISGVRIVDEYIRLMLDYYSKILANPLYATTKS